MNLLSKIKNIGAPKGQSNPIDIGVLNLSTILLISPGLFYVGLFSWFGFNEAAITLTITYILVSLCFPLIKKGKLELAKYLYVVVSISAIC